MDGGDLDDDETGAAGCPCLVIRHEIVAHQSVGKMGVMTGEDDSVADLRPGDRHGREQVGQPHGG